MTVKLMSDDFLEAKGRVTSVRFDGKAFQLDGNHWYSSFMPMLDENNDILVQKGDFVKFKFKQKGMFKNIVDGSLEIMPSPKDITNNYSPGLEPASSQTSPQKSSTAPVDWDAKDRRIVRQSCLKAAVEAHEKYKGDWNSFEHMASEIKKTAEDFEKWVYRT